MGKPREHSAVEERGRKLRRLQATGRLPANAEVLRSIRAIAERGPPQDPQLRAIQVRRRPVTNNKLELQQAYKFTS